MCTVEGERISVKVKQWFRITVGDGKRFNRITRSKIFSSVTGLIVLKWIERYSRGNS